MQCFVFLLRHKPLTSPPSPVPQAPWIPAEMNNQKMRAPSLLNLGLSSSGRILVVGDGDLGYSRVLALTSRHQICCSVLESRQELVKQYAHAKENYTALEDSGAKLYFEVDATELETTLVPQMTQRVLFDRIVFNFPQYPPFKDRCRNPIHKHRDLLRRFFTSASGLIKEEGQVWVTLKGGQGGTPAEEIEREWNNTWKVQDMAAYGDLVLFRVDTPDLLALQELGYAPCGYQSSGKWFHTTASRTHIFARNTDKKPIVCFPRMWRRDVSFTVDPDINEEVFKQECIAFLRTIDIDICTMELFDSYSSPEKTARGFTFRFASSSIPITQQYANGIVERLLEKFSRRQKH